MTIQEILEAHQIGSFSSDGHNRVMTCSGCRERLTGQGLSLDEIIRDHLAEVLDKHMQERESAAWEAGYEDGAVHAIGIRSHIDGLTQRDPKRPSNPYRKAATNGR